MRSLIDTNIFIVRENNSIVPADHAELLSILTRLKVDVLVHPKSFGEISKDSNKQRRAISLSKIKAYPILESPPDPTSDNTFLAEVGHFVNSHDQIDNFMLYAVYKDAIDYLITEDKRILKKAAKLNLRDRVFSCLEAKEFFKNYLPREKIEHPQALREEAVHNLNLDDPFFDSLKEEYKACKPDFVTWFKRISREGRKCFVYYRNNAISALLIFKDEKEAIPCSPPLPEKRRLKICTFKSEPSGNRLGELFIKLAVRYCVQNGIDEMYLTHFPKDDGEPFAKLLSEYGFRVTGRQINGENIYLKRLIPDPDAQSKLPITEISQRFYPSFYDGSKVKKFVVPIRPEYHKRLFDDYRSDSKQLTLCRYIDGVSKFIVEGNAISKAYLCRAKINQISKNDMLLFYRSQDKQEITTMGVVEEIYRMTDVRRITQHVGNRTVYSYKEIEEMAERPTLILLFKWHFYLPKPVELERLIELKVLKSAPQTITAINHEDYIKVKKESKLDGRYTID